MNALAEYRLPRDTRWLLCIGAAGETLPELRAALERIYPGCETRERVEECAEGAVPVVKAAGTPAATGETGTDQPAAPFSP